MADFALKAFPLEAFNALYARMERDFPRNERPGRLQMRRLLKRRVCRALSLYRDDALAGYVTYIRRAGDVMITFLAIEPEMRGMGCGSALLKLLTQRFRDADCLILEVEHPDFTRDKEEREIRLKRIAFYERAGFRLMRDVQYSAFGVAMQLMALPIGNSFAEVRARIVPVMMALYARLLPKLLLNNIPVEEMPPC